MHHRRRSRRRDKRTMLPCGCCEDIRGGRAAPQIDENEVCMGKAKAKKSRPKKKDKCLVNRKHEWYVETVVEQYRSPWTNILREWTSTYRVSTCIHCWRVKKKLVREPFGANSWRLRKRPIPKRPVKF
jgi:hypothetical protein